LEETWRQTFLGKTVNFQLIFLREVSCFYSRAHQTMIHGLNLFHCVFVSKGLGHSHRPAFMAVQLWLFACAEIKWSWQKKTGNPALVQGFPKYFRMTRLKGDFKRWD
jgi:hypothetical protein